MLSKKDIEKELGKGINIHPLHKQNIKENSINFTIGRNAWSLASCNVKISSVKGISEKSKSNSCKSDIIEIKKGQSAVYNISGKPYVILLPHATTIIETSEVIGVENYIGGTLHSKVGVVAQGIGAIGTMLGPCFSGHLMVSLHNITTEPVAIPVGDTFLSIVFHKLDTPSKSNKNTNVSGHVDKLAELGISINKGTREFLTQDWKCSVNGIRDKMKESSEYISYKRQIRKEKFEHVLKYLNVRNAILTLILAGLIVAGWFGARELDGDISTVWMERYWTVVGTAFVIPPLTALLKLFKTE